MVYYENIYIESIKDNALYHKTSLEAFVNIIKSNKIISYQEGGISFTRDKSFDFINYKGDFIGIIITVDKDKIKQRYKITPIDEYGYDDDGYRRLEREERVDTKFIPYNKYAEVIDVDGTSIEIYYEKLLDIGINSYDDIIFDENGIYDLYYKYEDKNIKFLRNIIIIHIAKYAVKNNIAGDKLKTINNNCINFFKRGNKSNKIKLNFYEHESINKIIEYCNNNHLEKLVEVIKSSEIYKIDDIIYLYNKNNNERFSINSYNLIKVLKSNYYTKIIVKDLYNILY